MDIQSFFFPIESFPTIEYASVPFINYAMVHKESFPKWEEADILLIGCPNRTSGALFASAEAVRQRLYGFSIPVSRIKIADLGNINPQTSPEALCEELADIMGYFLAQKKTVILMGGTQDLTYGQYLAYEQIGRQIEYVHIDPALDIKDMDQSMSHRSFNHHIFTYQPNFLFDYINLGYQRYFVSQEELGELKERNFSAVRYGLLQQDITQAEPYLRTADMVSLDVSSIRSRDIPGAWLQSPGGYSPVEACRLSRYSGLGYHVSSMNVAGYQAEDDPDGQGAMLIAMMIWYFIDGYYSKWNDHPREDRGNLRKYTVQLQTSIEAIHFFCHMQSGRWWMEVPFPSDIGKKFPRNRLIPCSAEDYELAKNDEIPDRWWLTFNKLK